MANSFKISLIASISFVFILSDLHAKDDIECSTKDGSKCPMSNNTFFFELNQLKKIGKELQGINTMGLYELPSGQKLWLKERNANIGTEDSLVKSYLTSRLLRFLCPNQVPTVVAVKRSELDRGLAYEDLLIGAYDIPTYKGWGAHGSKGYELLHLALDLMDIIDRYPPNIGTANVGGEETAVAVDFDLTDGFRSNWLFSESTQGLFANTTVGRIRGRLIHWINPLFEQVAGNHFIGDFFTEKVDEEGLRAAFNHMSKISDEDIKSVFQTAISELEFIYSQGVDKQKVGAYLQGGDLDFRTEYETDFKLNNVLVRLHQMKWVNDHINTVLSYFKNGQKNIDGFMTMADRNDDRYGFFLAAAAKDENLPLISDLLKNGAKDPRGDSLYLAVKNNRIKAAELLLTHGIRFEKSSNAWEWGGIYKGDYQLLITVINYGSLEMMELLLAQGITDPKDVNYALAWARQSRKDQMVELLYPFDTESKPCSRRKEH